MKILLGHDQAVADWVAKQPFGKPFHAPYNAIGVIDASGRLTGGFVFTGYTGDCVEMSVAGRGMVCRDAWRAMLSYVFDQLGCSRLQVHTSEQNKPVKRLLPKAGFNFEGPCRRLYGRHDGFQYALTTDDLPAFKARWRL